MGLIWRQVEHYGRCICCCRWRVAGQEWWGWCKYDKLTNLGEDVDLGDAAVEAVGHGHINEAVRATNGHSGLQSTSKNQRSGKRIIWSTKPASPPVFSRCKGRFRAMDIDRYSTAYERCTAHRVDRPSPSMVVAG